MSAIWFLAIMLMSHAPDINCRFNRKNSRTRRLILFLLTACPTFLVTVTPSLERPCRPGAKTAMKFSFCILRPDFASATNSWRFNILSPFVKEYCNGQASWLNLNKFQGGKNWALWKQDINYQPLNCTCLSWQPNTAFGSPAVNDSSALFGRHSFKKTMISSPFNSAGLKCSFHIDNSLSV